MKAALGVVAGAMALFLGVVLAVAMGGSSSAAGCGGGAGSINIQAIPATASIDGYSGQQLVNAAHIMNAATAMQLDARGQQIGVMVAMDESTLNNDHFGDNAENPDGTIADSLGLFQQQSSWGSTADRLDPERTATIFFKHLVAHTGWESEDPAQAAAEIQVNGWVTLPDGTRISPADQYRRYQQTAVDLTNQLQQKYSASSATSCTAGQAAYPLNTPYMMTDNFGPRSAPTEGATSWHKGDDLVGHCGDPIYAVLPGKVVQSDRLTLGIQSPDGFTILYLHSHLADRNVKIGDQVTRGQQISKVGDEAPATGCHLHLGVNITGNHNPQVAALPTDPNAPGYVDPEKFMALFGVTLCPPDWCKRDY